MSRNLCRTSCAWCYAPSESVKLVEEPRPAVEADCGYYWRYHNDGSFWVAHAECIDCGAKYLAWVAHGYPFNEDRRVTNGFEPPFFDLSYRSTFNDEPGDDDVPNEGSERSQCRALIRRALRECDDELAEWAMVQFAARVKPLRGRP